ncbi:MAG TPA: MFS transporter [Casimicrobiaceae bacterium]|nr:MFS transporter [Casimicrobiaceae bacterium]
MTGGRRRPSAFAFLIGLGIANHIVLAGSRVTVTLYALSLGAGTATVGLLMALYALLPALLAIPAGRLTDRIGVRAPMLVGSWGIALGAGAAFALPGLPTLFVAAPLIGVSFMSFQVATQYATGEMGGAAGRVRNFGLLALGYSTSSIVAPLVVGFTIDHFGFRASFALLMLLPLVPVAVLASDRLRLPGPHPAHAAHPLSRVLELVTHVELRRVFAINAMLSMAWEIHTIFVPIYGQSIGLSASMIGAILAAFAAATFTVRLAMPVIARRLTEHQVLTAALFLGGAVYLAIPFSRNAAMLASLSFCLGIALGAGQPMVMAMLHTHAPPGRMGEAAGVRMSLINATAVAVPLLFGVVGGAFGVAPVLWSVGVFLTSGGWFTRRAT